MLQADLDTPPPDRRSRTVTWSDPMAVLAQLANLNQDEMFLAFVHGDLPRAPVAELVGFDLIEVSDGHAVKACDAAENLCSPMGIVAGGVTATVMDAAMWVAVQSGIRVGTYASTTSLTVLLADARAIHRGRRTATAECSVSDEKGALYVHASCTLSCAEFG